MTTDWLEIRLGSEMQAVLNRSAWYLTPEQCIRNFFWLYRRDVLDANGNVCDYDDDLRNDAKLKKAWVYDYLDMHKENLERLGITEAHMKQIFPYVNFVKTGSNPTGATQNESWLPTVSEDSGEPKKRTRKSSIPQS